MGWEYYYFYWSSTGKQAIKLQKKGIRERGKKKEEKSIEIRRNDDANHSTDEIFIVKLKKKHQWQWRTSHCVHKNFHNGWIIQYVMNCYTSWDEPFKQYYIQCSFLLEINNRKIIICKYYIQKYSLINQREINCSQENI